MGFTRYWRRHQELEAEKFADFSEECAATIHGAWIKDALFDGDEVSFDGVPPCERFIISRISMNRVRDGKVSEFCKTEHLPYDQEVKACLDLLKKHFGDEVEIPNPS